MNQPTFTYGQATVSDLVVRKVERTPAGKVTLKDLEIDGQSVIATRRFWRSFFTRFGIAENVFRYFSPAEVFARISQRNGDDAFRFCIAHHPAGKPDPMGKPDPAGKPIQRASAAVRDYWPSPVSSGR